MSEFIAFFDENGVEFFDKDLNKVEYSNHENHTIYAVLPDEYFFFFQSDITSKRRAYITIEAYAKSLFPVENGFVGYIGGFLPLIGYICFREKIPDEYSDILKNAEVITTPFAVYLQSLADKRFIYESTSVCAAYFNSALKYYTLGDECLIAQRGDLPEDMEKADYSKEETINKLWDFVSSNTAQKINLAISQDTQTGFEGWQLARFALLAVFAVIFIIGGILRYAYYKKELADVNSKIEAVYKKALGDKHYEDPYGVLLYKAQYADSSNYDIDPLRLLYAASRAKGSYKLKIDYLSFGKSSIKIIGEVDNYSSLVNYVDRINALLSKKFIIQNTSSKNGKLLFTLRYENGES